MNNADTNELYGVLLSLIVGLFITTLTDRSASFKAVGHLPFRDISADCNWSTRQLLLHASIHTLLAR